MIDYQKILNENILNVFKNILIDIKKNGLTNNNHLYVTFITDHNNVKIPKWLKDKYPNNMTIVIQYEYYNLEIKEKFFEISLSFSDIEAHLKIGYDSIISFADPSANFGLKLQTPKIKKVKRITKKQSVKIKDNIINFSNFKKNQSK